MTQQPGLGQAKSNTENQECHLRFTSQMAGRVQRSGPSSICCLPRSMGRKSYSKRSSQDMKVLQHWVPVSEAAVYPTVSQFQSPPGSLNSNGNVAEKETGLHGVNPYISSCLMKGKMKQPINDKYSLFPCQLCAESQG